MTGCGVINMLLRKCPRCGSKGVVVIGYAIEDPMSLKE